MKKIQFLFKQKKPLKFLLGYLLWKTGLCVFITFKVKDVKFKFSRSGLSRSLFIDRDYINEDIDYLNRYLKKGDVFIDVGSNIGTWAIFAAQATGNIGEVLCFEPHPITFKYLKENITINNFANINAYNVGCSDTDGDLYFTSNLDDMNHIIAEKENAIIVPVKKLDYYTENYSKIKLIKIDVEGFELSVLKGAIKTLQKANIIIFESFEIFQNSFNYKTADMISFLQQNEFKVYKTNDINAGKELNGNYSSEKNENLIAFASDFIAY